MPLWRRGWNHQTIKSKFTSSIPLLGTSSFFSPFFFSFFFSPWEVVSSVRMYFLFFLQHTTHLWSPPAAGALLGHYHAQVSPCVGLAPSLTCVLEKKGTTVVLLCTACTRKKRNNCCTAVHSSTAVIAHGFWVHVGSIPWATSNRSTSQLALRRGAYRIARNLFTPLPHRLRPPKCNFW